MGDISDRIRKDVEADPALNVHGFTVEVASRGFLPRRRVLSVSGMVERPHDRDAIERIVNYHAGDAYEVELHIEVGKSAHA